MTGPQKRKIAIKSCDTGHIGRMKGKGGKKTTWIHGRELRDREN